MKSSIFLVLIVLSLLPDDAFSPAFATLCYIVGKLLDGASKPGFHCNEVSGTIAFEFARGPRCFIGTAHEGMGTSDRDGLETFA